MRIPSLTAALLVAVSAAVSNPRITGVVAVPPGQSSSPQILTVSGESFLAGLSLTVITPGGGSQLFKGADIRSRTESSFQVSMALATTGTYSLIVTNPDGGASAAFGFTVTPSKPAATAEAPIIDAVAPLKPVAQPDAQALRVDGKRFVSGLTVYVTDPTGQVATVTDVIDMTANGFRVSVVLGMEGQYTLTVKNPDGGASNAFSVTVTKMV